MSETPTKKSRSENREVNREPYPQRQKKTNANLRRYSPSRYMKPEWEPTKGSSETPISDLPIIALHLKQVSRNEDFMKQIHLILFQHVSKTKDVKKNIGGFTGLSKQYDKEETASFIEAKLTSRGHKFLRQMYMFFGLKKHGTEKKVVKEVDVDKLASAIFDFIQNPDKKKVSKKVVDFALDGAKKKPTTTAAGGTKSKKSKAKSSSKKRKRSNSGNKTDDESAMSEDDKSDSESSKKGKGKAKGKKSNKSEDEEEGTASETEESSSKKSKKRRSSSESSSKASEDESEAGSSSESKGKSPSKKRKTTDSKSKKDKEKSSGSNKKAKTSSSKKKR